MTEIVTDSGADMTAEEAQALGVHIAPLFIQFPEGEVASADISADEFYERLEAMVPEIPSTSQPSAGIFAALYRELLAESDRVLSIHISSGLSGTAQSAQLGAAQVEEGQVHVIDTMTLSGGQRFQVLAAVEAIRAGWDIEAIYEKLDQIREATETVFTLETLDYLARGGRIGRVQSIAGSLLSIKPVIHVSHEDGKYSNVGRARTMKRAMDKIVEHLRGIYGSDEPLWVTIVHGKRPDYADALADALEATLTVGKLETRRVSPVLGVHTGPGLVGATVVPMATMEVE